MTGDEGPAVVRKPWRTMRAGKGGDSRRVPVPRSPFIIPWLLFTYRSRIFLWTLAVAAVIGAKLLFTKVDPVHFNAPKAESRTLKELRVLRTALEWFRADCQRYPSTEEGLKALVRDPGIPAWAGNYIDGLPPDVWGRPFQYACSNDVIALGSMGPDGLPGTGDDVASPDPDWKALMERIPLQALPRVQTPALSPTNAP